MLLEPTLKPPACSSCCPTSYPWLQCCCHAQAQAQLPSSVFLQPPFPACSGAVGQEFLRVLHERNFPYSDIKMLASKRSAGGCCCLPSSCSARHYVTRGVQCLSLMALLDLVTSPLPVFAPAGKKYTFEGVEYTVEELTEDRCASSLCCGCVDAAAHAVR